MKKVTITRFGSIPGMGTFGALKTDGFSCYTLEREWMNNETGVSCIPLGSYMCEIVNSPSKGEVYEIKNVPGRDHILMHSANVQTELQGCVALGDKLGYYQDHFAVLNSRDTVNEFMHIMNGEELLLSIERA